MFDLLFSKEPPYTYQNDIGKQHPFSPAQKMNRKSQPMPIDTITDHCTDPTQELSIKIPCRLAERVDAYARDTGTDIENVVIEALDVFLRGRNNRHRT